jgi:thiamine pyrophosphokinase
MHTTVVFTGGPSPDPDDLARAGRRLEGLTPDLVLAADGGLHVAQDLGVAVDVVVGDLDSVDPARLDAAVAGGTTLDRHPVDKDETDLELALDTALAAGTDHVVVLGVDDGRLDHLVGGIAVLSAGRFAPMRPEAWLGGASVVPVRGERRVPGTPGALVSLLAVHGPASGVSTEGLEWRLDGERLEPGSSRGLSNRFTDDGATVRVASGCVVVIVPGDRS